VTWSNYNLTSPVSVTIVSISSLNLELSSLNAGPWLTATQVSLDGTLTIDVRGLSLADLDGFTLQLINSAQVSGQFEAVTVTSSSSLCPISASLSPDWKLVFQVDPSCTAPNLARQAGVFLFRG